MTLRGEDVCLHAQLAAADDLSLVGSGGGGVALQRDQAGVDRVDDPLGIREEILVELVRRGDPVARTDDDGRRIQIVEAHVRQILRDLVEERASCAGVGGQHHAAGLLDGRDEVGVIQRDKGRHVNDVRLDAVLLGERLGCVDRAVERCADGEDGEILAIADLIDRAGGPLVLFGGNAALVELFALAVDTLGLEDDAGIGAVQSRLHDALGLVRSGREEDLQAGDVGDDGDPVLRMLRAVLCADGHTQDHRHLEDTGGHGLPLGHLVEDLVACTAEEVAVHQLDDGAAAAHAVTDGGTDDSSLGNRGVEQAGVRDNVHQAAVDRVCAAPVAHVFAVGDERGILIILVDERLEDGVADVVDLHVGELAAVLVEREALLLGKIRVALAALLRAGDIQLLTGHAHGADMLVGEHEVRQIVRVLVEVDIRRDLLVVGCTADHGHAVGGVLQELGKELVRLDAGFHERLAELDDRVVAAPVFDLLLGAVSVLVRGGVADQTIGYDVEQDGAFVVLDELHLALVCVDNSQRVPAVDTLGVHLARGDAGAETCGHVVGHGLAHGLTAHAIEVVKDVEDDGQTTLAAFLPEGLELIHSGEVHCLVDRAAAERRIADVADDDALLVVVLLVQRSACRNGGGAADDGVVGIDAERQEEGVHGAAHAVMEAVFTGKDLGDSAIEQETDSQLLDVAGVGKLLDGCEGLAAKEVFHDLHELFIRELVDAAEALGEDLGVASVGAEGDVVLVQQVRFADAGGLLAVAQVRRAGIGRLDAVVVGLGLDEGEHMLKLTADGHVAVDADEVFLGVVAFFQLLLDGLVVLADGDIFKVDIAGLADFYGIDIQRFRHNFVLPFSYLASSVMKFSRLLHSSLM